MTPICANGGENRNLCLYAVLFNQLNEGVMVISNDAKIRDLNENACEIFDSTKEEIINTFMKDWMVDLTKYQPNIDLEEFIKKDHSKPRLQIKRKSGVILTVELNFTQIYVDGEQSFLAIIRDITKIEQQEKEKLQNERFKGVLEMAGSTCHEINQPLQVMLGYTEMLIGESKNKKWAAKIKEQIERLAKITKKLSSITKYETMPYSDKGNIIDLDKSQ